MKKNKFFGLLLTAAMTTALLAGCGDAAKPAATEGEKTTEAAGSEGTEAAQASAGVTDLKIAISANPPCLDPPIANSNIVGGIGTHIYEGLFAMNESYEPVPNLAESYEVSEDGMEYTIKIREGVKFHNGDEMKAEDVVASMTHWLENSAKAKTLIGGSVFEKVDDYTIKMTVNQASSDILTVLASPVQFAAIYPEESVAAAGDTGITDYIGTGPYKFVEWKPDQYVALERYEEYTPSPNASAGGIAGVKNCYADTITYMVVTDEATRLAGVQSGEYDIAEDIPVENFTDLQADSSIALDVNSGGTLNLFLNTTKGIMADANMRQAILAAINCDDIMLASYGNPDLYLINCGWMNPTDATWANEAGSEYYNQNDPDKAAELLAQAGYNGETITLVTTSDYPEMYNATLVVQAQLKAVGINAEVNSTDFETFMQNRSNPDTFDLFITSNSYNMIPIQLSVLDSGWAGLDAAEVPEGISAVRGASDSENAKQAWADLQGFLYEYGAATVLGHYTGVSAHGAAITGTEYLRFNLYWNVQ